MIHLLYLWVIRVLAAAVAAHQEKEVMEVAEDVAR
jgi:hypothetical protein